MKRILSCILLSVCIATASCRKSPSPDALTDCDVGFNYLHETMTNLWTPLPEKDQKAKEEQRPRSFLPKYSAERKRDFKLMAQIGAKAVRIHGCPVAIDPRAEPPQTELTQDWVLGAVDEANAVPLRVWFSFRANYGDLGYADWAIDHQKDDKLDEHFYADPDRAKEIRRRYVDCFRKSLEQLRGRTIACLVIANELPHDLGYKYLKTCSAYKPEVELLVELIGIARSTLGKDVPLTYAALPDGWDHEIIDWAPLVTAGLSFVSFNSYWDADGTQGKHGFLGRLETIHSNSGGKPVAITEFGAVTCSDANKYGGSGANVAVQTLQGHLAGEKAQSDGVAALLSCLRYCPGTGQGGAANNIPVCGMFPFTWDGTDDSTYGLVRGNIPPWPHDRSKEYADDEEWTSSCYLETRQCVPVGKPAVQCVARFFNGGANPHPPTEVILDTSSAGRSADCVDIQWAGSGDVRTRLKYLLKTTAGSDDKGKVIWGLHGVSRESFVCLDESAAYTVTVHWANSDETTEVNLEARSDQGDFWCRTYDESANRVTVVFGSQKASAGALRIVDFVPSTEPGPGGGQLRVLTARVRNVGSTPQQLALTGELCEVDPAIIERRRRDPDLEGPFLLGLERMDRNQGRWTDAQGYRWNSETRNPGDNRTGAPPTARIEPGETRAFFEFLLRDDSSTTQYQAVLVDPAGGRIDQRLLDSAKPK